MSTQHLVHHWMKPAQTVSTNTSFRRVLEIMEKTDTHCLVVIANDAIVGIITLGDVRAALPGDETTRAIWDVNNTWDRITVRQIMSDQVITIHPHADMAHAASIMLRHNISRLPITDRKGRLLGIISSPDIYRMLITEGVESEVAVV